MRNRRGVAMLAALWLVVAISVVALIFSMDAKERRTLGLRTSERGVARGADLGGLAMMQAVLETALRSGAQNVQALSGTRAGDPWMDIDSVYSGPVYIDSMRVDVRALDLGTKVNINTATDTSLRAFFSEVLGDYPTADKLTEMIMDWRDLDDIPRVGGDERDGYIKQGLLALPTNEGFREVSDLLMVESMTTDIYDKVAPYLTTYGSGTININTAPTPVLRSLPGMTDQILATILNARSRGLRISSVAQVVPGAGGVAGGGRGGRGGQLTGAQTIANLQLDRLQRAATVNTTEVLLTLVSRAGPQAAPVELRVLLNRAGSNANIGWEQW